MHHVFISYAHRDRTSVDAVVAALRAEPGVEVWIDERDIQASVPWFDEIEDAIRGAAVVLVCETYAWHGSQTCLIEAERARELAKPTVYVDLATQSPMSIVSEVRRTVAQYKDTAAAEDLLVRSARWDRDGRRRSALASRRALYAYRHVVNWYGPRLPSDVREFVDRSRKHQRRRRWVTGLGVALVVSLIGIAQLFNLASDKVKKEVATADQQLEYQSQAYELSQYSIYPELDSASKTAPNLDQAYLYRDRLTSDLSVSVPVKMTSATAGAAPFTATTGPLTVHQGDLTAMTDGRDGVLTVQATGPASVRRITLAGPPSELKWNHDGSLLAATLPSGIAIVDVRDGTLMTTLAGFPRLVNSLSWSADDRQITAIADTGQQATWDVTSADVIATDPTDWYVGLTAVRNSGLMVAVTRDGRLVEIDPTEHSVVWQGSAGAGVYAGIASTAKDAIVARTELGGMNPTAVVLNLGTHAVRELPLAGCQPRALSVDPAQQQLAVACNGDGVGIVNLATGRFSVQSSSVAIVSVAWSGERLLLGTIEGAIEESATVASQFAAIFHNDCFGGAEHLTTTSDSHYLFQAGDGADLIGCAHRGTQTSGSNWHFDVVAVRTQPGYQAGAVAISADNRYVAFGYSDGTIRTFDVVDIDPRAVHHDAAGEIRGLAYSDDGRELVAVTRDGQVLAYSTAQDQMSVTQLDQVAAARVAIAKDAGVYQQ